MSPRNECDFCKKAYLPAMRTKMPPKSLVLFASRSHVYHFVHSTICLFCKLFFIRIIIKTPFLWDFLLGKAIKFEQEPGEILSFLHVENMKNTTDFTLKWLKNKVYFVNITLLGHGKQNVKA